MKAQRIAAGFALVAAAFSLPAHAGSVITICYNYGCLTEALVVFSDGQLEPARAALAAARDAAAEREALAAVIGRLYRIAGEQTPVAADRRGNYLDDGVDGRMDCIDHSTSTTRLLRLLEARGWLRFHRVMEPARRARLVFQHFSAVIEETARLAASEPGGGYGSARFAVDSWFADNGDPAAILPLADWFEGEGPNVE